MIETVIIGISLHCKKDTFEMGAGLSIPAPAKEETIYPPSTKEESNAKESDKGKVTGAIANIAKLAFK